MTENKKERTLKGLYHQKIIPIVRTNSLEEADKIIQLLKTAEFKTVEITLTIPGAVDLIKKYSHDDKFLVGAGTILNLNDVNDCIDAGAKYLVAPCIIDGMSEVCKENDIVSIMSGLTPYEIYKAWKKGSDIVKVFPANSMGGPTFIKSLKSVFPHVPLLPTGGVQIEDVKGFFDAGADVIGVGNSLVDLGLLQDEDQFIKSSKKFLNVINEQVMEGSI